MRNFIDKAKFSFRIWGVTLTTILVVLMSRCHIYTQTLENSAGDNYFCDAHTSKILRLAEDAILSWRDSSYSLTNAGAITYTFDNKTFKHVINIQYGPDLTEVYDGIRRKGSMDVVWTDNIEIPGSEVKITMNLGFGFNDWNCTGTILWQNWGDNGWGQNIYGVESDIDLWEPAYNFEWTNEYQRVRIRGNATKNTADDWWAVWGTSYARNRQGRFYNATIKDSLYFANDCEWGIIKGRVDIQHVDATQRVFVSYGGAYDTSCNDFIKFWRGKKTQFVKKHLDGLAK